MEKRSCYINFRPNTFFFHCTLLSFVATKPVKSSATVTAKPPKVIFNETNKLTNRRRNRKKTHSKKYLKTSFENKSNKIIIHIENKIKNNKKTTTEKKRKYKKL